jgi:hypothetical protein
MGLCKKCLDGMKVEMFTPWTHCHHDEEQPTDRTRTVEMWVNVYKSTVYGYSLSSHLFESEEEAKRKAFDTPIDTVKIQWEESI